MSNYCHILLLEYILCNLTLNILKILQKLEPEQVFQMVLSLEAVYCFLYVISTLKSMLSNQG